MSEVDITVLLSPQAQALVGERKMAELDITLTGVALHRLKITEKEITFTVMNCDYRRGSDVHIHVRASRERWYLLSGISSDMEAVVSASFPELLCSSDFDYK